VTDPLLTNNQQLNPVQGAAIVHPPVLYISSGGAMELSRLVVQLIVALVCAGAANMLIPRHVPGKFFGFLVIGLLGVVVGEWGFNLLRSQYGFNYNIFYWSIERVPILPSIIGSAIVLYVVTTLLQWGRYSR
jgi:uncharacterized membrane protein YeaQ/YmgE (transglycosylase-associated protein family)